MVHIIKDMASIYLALLNISKETVLRTDVKIISYMQYSLVAS